MTSIQAYTQRVTSSVLTSNVQVHFLGRFNLKSLTLSNQTSALAHHFSVHLYVHNLTAPRVLNYVRWKNRWMDECCLWTLLACHICCLSDRAIMYYWNLVYSFLSSIGSSRWCSTEGHVKTEPYVHIIRDFRWLLFPTRSEWGEQIQRWESGFGRCLELQSWLSRYKRHSRKK